MEEGLVDFLNCVTEVLPRHPYFQRPQRQTIVLPKCRQTITQFMADPRQLDIRQLQFIQMILRRRFDLNQILPTDYCHQSWLKSQILVRRMIASRHREQRQLRQTHLQLLVHAPKW